MKNVVLLLAATIMLVATACQRTGQTLDGRTCGDFGEQHWHLDAPLAIDTRMQAREMRDDGGLAAAAFANDGAARRFGGCAIAVEAFLDTSNRGSEQRIFHQYPLGTVHHFAHASSMTDVFLSEAAAMAEGCGRSRFASNTGRMSSSVKKSDRAALGPSATAGCGRACWSRAAVLSP